MSQKDRPQLHQVLESLMAEVAINEAELARKTGIPQPTLHRILSGATRSPRGHSLAPLANFFSITINQLMGVDPLPKDRVAGTHNTRICGWTPIPLISWRQAAQWDKFRVELREKNWKDWTSTDLEISDDAFALQVKGDAMAPMFPEDTVLIIEPVRQARNRDYVVVLPAGNESAMFRQLLLDGDDRYLRAVDNQFRTMQSDRNNKIIGTLIQSRFDFHRDAQQPDDEK